MFLFTLYHLIDLCITEIVMNYKCTLKLTYGIIFLSLRFIRYTQIWSVLIRCALAISNTYVRLSCWFYFYFSNWHSESFKKNIFLAEYWMRNISTFKCGKLLLVTYGLNKIYSKKIHTCFDFFFSNEDKQNIFLLTLKSNICKWEMTLKIL